MYKFPLAFFISFALSSLTAFGQPGNPVNWLVDVYPQAVVGTVGGDTFTQELIITNGSASACTGTVFLTDGRAIPPGTNILTNGENVGNFIPFTIEGQGSECLTFTNGGPGLETFSVWVESLDPSCGQQLATETRYRVEGNANEVFSSPSQPLIPEGSCSLLPVHLERGSHDTGFAATGVPPWWTFDKGTEELCFQLLDKGGDRLPGRTCLPFDGRQSAFNLSQVFPDQADSGFEGTAEVCYENGSADTYVAATAIGVFKNPAGPQYASSTLQTNSPKCDSSPNTLCLNEGRFKVKVDWSGDNQTTPGSANVFHQRDDSGLFYFFDPSNWEMMVKVLDGCSVNERFWVFAGSTSDVGFELTVTDTRTNEIRTYTNPVGEPSPTITDTSAFASCP